MVLLVVPFALGTVVYLGSLITPPLPESAGNTVAAVPLLVILLAAMVLSLGRGSRARPDAPGRPAASGGA